MKLLAVILTGTRDSHNPLIAGTGLQSKVLLPILGRPMVLYVLDALAGSRYKPDIYVSSNDPQVDSLKKYVPFSSFSSESRAVLSMLKALERVPGDGWVLLVSGDHPLLTSEMIDYFTEEVMRRDLAFGAAAVRRSRVRREYPKSRRTYFAVKGDAYSGGNLFLINRRKFEGNVSIMETIDQNRKKPWKSVFMLDPLTCLRILLRQWDIHEVTTAASRVFGCKVGVVDMPFAECCMDVDKPSDREMAEIILGHRLEAKSFEAAGSSLQLVGG